MSSHGVTEHRRDQMTMYGLSKLRNMARLAIQGRNRLEKKQSKYDMLLMVTQNMVSNCKESKKKKPIYGSLHTCNKDGDSRW